MRRFKRPSTVIGAALLLALGLGGTATAAKFITSKDIKNGTIEVADLSSGAKKALKGNAGPGGAGGPAGAPGAPGPQGPAGPSGISEIVAAQADDVGLAIALCPPGTRPLSGGGVEGGAGYIWLSGMAVDDDGRPGWVVAGDVDSPVTALVYCSSGVSKVTLPNGTSARPLSLRKVRALQASRR